MSTSARTPAWLIWPDASLVPSCETARHDTSFEWPSRKACVFFRTSLSTTIDPSGYTTYLPSGVYCSPLGTWPEKPITASGAISTASSFIAAILRATRARARTHTR